MTDTVLRAARMLDVPSMTIVENPQVVVCDHKIDSVRNTGDEVPAGSDIVDVGSLTLMPGLVDAHLHFWGVHSLAPLYRYYLEKDGSRALLSVCDARDLLRAGFTTVRDLGSFVAIEVGLGIDEGLIPGPRVVSSGPFIFQRSGTWECYDLPASVMETLNVYADGEDECRRIVRQRARDGARVIKIGLSSGQLDDVDQAWGDDLTNLRVNYSLEESRTLAEEAHNMGLPITAHAVGDGAVNRALDAGLDSIEHGHAISDKTRERIAKSGTPVVSTVSAQWARVNYGPKYGQPDAWTDVARRHHENMVESHRRSHEMGVSFALGTDFVGAAVFPHGENAMEYVFAVEMIGMTEKEAIRAGLVVGPKILGLEDEIGVVGPGRLADIIGVDGDPLTDIRALQRVRFVMKNGQVIHSDSATG